MCSVPQVRDVAKLRIRGWGDRWDSTSGIIHCNHGCLLMYAA